MTDTEQATLTTREEWRVTGEPGNGYPAYSFVFGNPYEGDKSGTPEERARAFVRMINEHGGWPDGPRIHRRTITETEWEPIT